MRLGIVRGHVVLKPAVAAFRGRTLVVLEPVTMENLRAGNGLGGGKALVAARPRIPSGRIPFRWMHIVP